LFVGGGGGGDMRELRNNFFKRHLLN